LAQRLDQQIVARQRTGFFYGASRQFQDGMRGEAGRQTPGRNGISDLPNFPFLVEVDQVYRKLHEERVNRFARNDPQTIPRFQPFVLEQADTALRAGIRNIHGIAQNGVAGLIPH
jgi:hypothetical protein